MEIATASVASAPQLGNTAKLTDGLTTLTVVCAVVLLVIAVLRRRRSATPDRGGDLRLLETVRLGHRRAVHLISVGSERIIVGSSECGLVRLGAGSRREVGDDSERTEQANSLGLQRPSGRRS